MAARRPKQFNLDAEAQKFLDEFGAEWYEFFREYPEDDEADDEAGTTPTLSDLIDTLVMMREFSERLPLDKRQRFVELFITTALRAPGRTPTERANLQRILSDAFGFDVRLPN